MISTSVAGVVKPVVPPKLAVTPPTPAIELVRAWWDCICAEAPAPQHRSFREYAEERFAELEAKLLDR